MYYAACQARFALSTRGGPMTGVYYAADSPNLFRDEFSQFWLTNNLFYTLAISRTFKAQRLRGRRQMRENQLGVGGYARRAKGRQ
jgi:hypothetical protein